jgi:hypothetical protein
MMAYAQVSIIRSYHNELWSAFLGEYAPEEQAVVAGCGRVYRVWETKESKKQALRPMSCQHRNYCIVDANRSTSELVDDNVEAIKALFDKLGRKIQIGICEGTLPKNLWNQIGLAVNGEKRMRAAVARVLKRVLGDVAPNLSVHVFHSRNPLEGYYPHVHGLVLPFRRNELGGFERFDVYLSQEVLARFSPVWKEEMIAEFGFKDDGRKWVFHWGFANGEAGLVHRLEYQYRKPIKDLYKFVTSGLLPVEDWPSVNRVWLRKLMVRPKYEKRSQWFGWMSDGVRSKSLAGIGLVVPKLAVRRRERRRCFDEATGEEFFPTPCVLDYQQALASGLMKLKRKREPGRYVESFLWS